MAICSATYAQTTTEHVVQRGETLQSIATKYGVSVDELKQANKDAQNYLYAGMKLVIPQKTTTVSPAEPVKNETVVTNQTTPVTTVPEYSSSSKSKKTTVSSGDDDGSNAVWGIIYTAGTFDDVKASGHYGILTELYDIAGSGLGISAILASFNFGLADSGYTSDLIQIGPNYSVALGNSKDARLVLPVYVNYEHFGSGEYKQLTGKSGAWGWSVNPKINYGVLQAGLLFSGGFSGGNKVSVGFTAGLVF